MTDLTPIEPQPLTDATTTRTPRPDNEAASIDAANTSDGAPRAEAESNVAAGAATIASDSKNDNSCSEPMTTTITTTTTAEPAVANPPTPKSPPKIQRRPRNQNNDSRSNVIDRGAKKSKHLTNTNTDLLCWTSGDGVSAADASNKLSLWVYRFNLWTGLYMLNPRERMVFHALGWLLVISFLLYIHAFLHGLVDGIRQGNRDFVSMKRE